ncbi:hypothetical protein EPUS_09099 [Endocarpon pusillum Z07020]|uniref:DDE-1 domain-containing protein n=1 Tax=Endocarpon pusillum (strain Z07020 / HMAS-L-300199) TaxID=1263415 RepID=U1GR97_ENDPU|nr:uncharacterized protein EPUS_09099 [Endocarpon pusillum Z07020]ERF74893.1 hypothetical protein EPUS_09099 [Endocarpon pusillum Z07020]
MASHHDVFMLQSDSPKELDRAAAEDPVVIDRWYTSFIGKIQRCAIQPGDIYNCDEGGFRIGIGKREKIIVPASKTRTRVSSTKESTRELVTLVKCVDALGNVLPPMIICQSTSDKVMEDWVRATDVPDDYLIETSSTAYMNDEIALVWLKHFDKHITKKQIGEWRMLILDGHSSHTTYKFLSYCQKHKIMPFFLPPHTTYILQPLDVAIFQPYKH